MGGHLTAGVTERGFCVGNIISIKIAKGTAENAQGEDHAFMGVDTIGSLFHDSLCLDADRTDQGEDVFAGTFMIFDAAKGKFLKKLV